MKKVSKEVDLYVAGDKITKREIQELSNFITSYKRRRKSKPSTKREVLHK